MSNRDIFDAADVAAQVTEADIQAVAAIKSLFDEPVFDQVTALLATCKGKVLVTGSGTDGSVARRAAHLFSISGTPAFFLSPDDGLHRGLGALMPEDIILAFSKDGNSPELNDFCQRGRTLAGHLVVITANPDSPLSHTADKVLSIPQANDCDLGGGIATGCTLAFSALSDVLVKISQCLRGHERESFFFTHPAGVLGQHAVGNLKRLQKSGQR